MVWSLILRLKRGVAVTTNRVFIDWLNVRQQHDQGGLPIVGDGVSMQVKKLNWCESNADEMLLSITPGERFRYSMPSARREGSHSTAVRVRCDGSLVSLSGNPGRYDRADNLFSFGIEETVDRASAIVARDGLPAFAAGERRFADNLNERDAKLGLWERWTGAVYNEFHATMNVSLGNEAISKEYMLWAGSQRAARIAKGVFGDETVVFGSLAKKGKPLHKAIVVYRKAEEMVAHARGDHAKKAMRASEVYQYARDVGLVRIECKWGSHFLRDNGLRFMGGTTMSKVISIFERETDFLLGASPERGVRLVSDLPSRLRLPALAWIRGDDLRSLLPRSTYFRVTKALRGFGLDVSEPRRDANPGQAERDLQALLDALPRFEVKALERPDWYELPALALAA